MAIETGSSLEKFTSKFLYETGAKRLLECDIVGDAHHDSGVIKIVNLDGTIKPGIYKLGDYYSWEVDPEIHLDSDAAEKKYLLEQRKAILDVRFYEEEEGEQDMGNQYFLFDPKTHFRKGSIIKGMLLSEADSEPRIKVPPEIEPGPIVVSHDFAVIVEPHKDRQLQELHKIWTKPKEESSHPSPEE